MEIILSLILRYIFFWECRTLFYSANHLYNQIFTFRMSFQFWDFCLKLRTRHNHWLKLSEFSKLKFLSFSFGNSERFLFNFLLLNDSLTMCKSFLDSNRDRTFSLAFIFFLQRFALIKLIFFDRFAGKLFFLFYIILYINITFFILFNNLIIYFLLLGLIIFNSFTVTGCALLEQCFLQLILRLVLWNQVYYLILVCFIASFFFNLCWTRRGLRSSYLRHLGLMGHSRRYCDIRSVVLVGIWRSSLGYEVVIGHLIVESMERSCK